MRGWTAAVVLSAALAPRLAAAATLTFLTQERFVEQADLWWNGATERIDATDFGVFDAVAGDPFGPDQATQVSALYADRIVALVSHDVVSHGPDGPLQGESSFAVTFELDEAAAYTLSLDVTRITNYGNIQPPFIGDYDVVLEATLTGPAGIVFDFHWDDDACSPNGEDEDCDLDLALFDEGSLEAGSYALSARSFGHDGGVSTFSGLPIPTATDGSVALEFVVPEPDESVLLIAGLAALTALRRLR